MSANTFRENLRGIVVAVATVAMIVSPIFRYSPVKSTVDVEATVEGFTFNPNRSGGTSRYTYILRLDNGDVIVASDYLSKPHIKGSRVKIDNSAPKKEDES